MILTRSIVAIVLVLSLLFVLTACSDNKDNKDKIIGTWNMEGGGTFTFNKDGTFRVGEARDYVYGTYSIDGDKLTCTYEGKTETVTIKTLTSSKLVLSDGKETETLTR